MSTLLHQFHLVSVFEPFANQGVRSSCISANRSTDTIGRCISHTLKRTCGVFPVHASYSFTTFSTTWLRGDRSPCAVSDPRLDVILREVPNRGDKRSHRQHCRPASRMSRCAVSSECRSTPAPPYRTLKTNGIRGNCESAVAATRVHGVALDELWRAQRHQGA